MQAKKKKQGALKENEIKTLIKVIIQNCNISLDEFYCKNRRLAIITARSFFAYIMQKYDFTLIEIANRLDKTHPNIIALCNNIDSYLKFNIDYKILYEQIMKDFLKERKKLA